MLLQILLFQLYAMLDSFIRCLYLLCRCYCDCCWCGITVVLQAALKEEEELSECFFYPVTNPPRQAESSNSHEDKSDANRSEGASPVSTFQDKASTVVRGYDEQVQRLRNGPNGIETKRREQERLHRQVCAAML